MIVIVVQSGNNYISVADYIAFKKNASITVNGGSTTSHGQPILAIDTGDVYIETSVPSDYGEITTTRCTRNSSDGENVSCGNCTALNCQFTVNGTVRGELIAVNIEIDTLQASFIQFIVPIKGIFFIYMIN